MGDEISPDTEQMVRERIDREANYNRGKIATCRTRTDKLAIPQKRLILALYQDHAYHLSRDRVELIKRRLQELYAMTPEETEKYFEEMRQQLRKKEMRDKIKRALKKQYLRQKRKEREAAAYCFIEQLFKSGMNFALKHPVPPLVSIRLRNLSDIILEQLCDLRSIARPRRNDADQTGTFMITIADWLAIAIEHVYYLVQLKKNRELEEIDKQNELDKAVESSSATSETEEVAESRPFENEDGDFE